MKNNKVKIEAIPELIARGYTQKQIAILFGVSLSTLKRAEGFKEAIEKGRKLLFERVSEIAPQETDFSSLNFSEDDFPFLRFQDIDEQYYISGLSEDDFPSIDMEEIDKLSKDIMGWSI